MDGWILLEEYYNFLQQELEARLRREQILEGWLGMGNRRKIKTPEGRVYATQGEHRDFRDRIRQIKESFVGRYNAYVCDVCDKSFLTLDVDEGTTPIYMPCLATEGCQGTAESQGYPDGEPPESMGPPIIHWIAPIDSVLVKLPPKLVEHVERGGLIAKPTSVAPDWVKAELA